VCRLHLTCEASPLTFLLITLAILSKFRHHLKIDRIEIEINLVTALLLLHLCNLLQEAAEHQKLGCEIITVSTHFFLLASGKYVVWFEVKFLPNGKNALIVLREMLGLITHTDCFIYSYCRRMDDSGSNNIFVRMSKNALEYSCMQRLRLRRLNYIVGWVTPAIIVAFSATFGFITETYMEKITTDNIVIALGYPTVKLYSYCWISAQHRTRIPAVILPLACFWLFNFFVTVKAVILVARLKRQEKSFQRRCSLHKDESLSDNVSPQLCSKRSQSPAPVTPQTRNTLDFRFFIRYEFQLSNFRI